MKKSLLFLLVFVIIVSVISVFGLNGCKGVKEVAEGSAPSKEELTTESAEEVAEEKTSVEEGAKWFIASSVMTLQFPWFLGTVEGMENIVKEKGNIEFVWQDAQFDINTQINQLENFAEMGVDGVIVYATDAKAVIPTMKDLHERGIKIVTADYKQEPDSPEDVVWETFCGHDFREMGRVAGEVAVEYLKTITDHDPIVVWLTSPPSGQVSIDRVEGFKEIVLSELPNVQIVEEGNPQATRESAQSVFESLLMVYPRIDLVCGHNSDFVLGAYNAAVAAGRDEIKFIGMAGYADVLTYIDEGNDKWLGEVLQDPVVLGETAMAAMIEALEGKELPDVYELPKPEAITPKNIDNYDWRNWKWLGLEK